MKKYSCTQEPIEIFGLQKDLLPNHFWRLPKEMMSKVSKGAANWAVKPVGGRIKFRTDSSKVTITTQLNTNDVDWAIPLSGSAGADVYIGSRMNTRYAGVAAPRSYAEKEGTLTFTKENFMEDITINLPRNEELKNVWIEIEKEASIEAPTPYTIKRPLVFYGSSITQGGCASRPGNAYTAHLSRWLDADYINLGFSGSARGEIELADYISTLEMSVFIYDYDHNAPSVEHLADTHEPFYRYIRNGQPELPIIILSRPDFDGHPDSAAKRRQVIYNTYLNAKAAGDNCVFFIDGETLFGADNREACTIDGCHPNDLGFMRMAKVIYPVLKKCVARLR